jgi:uncharacterized protein (TIGR02001 family)
MTGWTEHLRHRLALIQCVPFKGMPTNQTMTKKTIIACLGALTTAAGSAFAQTPTTAPAVPAAAPSITVTATGSVVSQYMFRGLRLGSASFQPSVEVGAGNLVLGAWATTPFDADKVPDSSDPEIDFYGSYNIALEDGITLTPGFTSYHYPKAPTNMGYYRTTFEPNIALSYVVDGVKLTPKVYYDTVLKGPTYEITAFYALPLKNIGSELDFTATYGSYKWKESSNDASPDVKSWGQYWLVGVAAPFQITRNSKLTVGVSYTEGFKAFTKQGTDPKLSNSYAVGRGVASISYALSF